MSVTRTKRVTILGAFFADLACRTRRMPAWGETMHGEGFSLGPGGKGSNQAVAAARQGAEVALITRVGRDPFADMARRMFEEEAIIQDGVSVDEDLPIGTATILIDSARGENAIVIVPGACDRLGLAEIDAAAPGIASSAYFVSQLELPLDTCLHGIRLAHRSGVPVLLNPAPAVALPAEIWPVRLSGTVYCHKPMRKSYSELGFRRGRRAPSAMACGRSKAYRPRKLMCLNRSGETRATSASLMAQPSMVSWSMAAWM